MAHSGHSRDSEPPVACWIFPELKFVIATAELSPELVFGVFVTLELAKLYCAAFDDTPKVHFHELRIPFGPSGTHCTQSKNSGLVGHYVMNVDAQCALR